MNSQWQVDERRLLELLADRATFGLTASEDEELRELKSSFPYFDVECMEQAAATVQLAVVPAEPLPETVHGKIRASWKIAESSQR